NNKKSEMSMETVQLPVGQKEGKRMAKDKREESKKKRTSPKIFDRFLKFYGKSIFLKKRIPFELQVLAASPRFYSLLYFPLIFFQHILIEKHKIHGLISIMFKVLNHSKIKNAKLTLLIINLSL